MKVAAPKSFLYIHLQKSLFFQLPAFYFVHPWLTILLFLDKLTCIDCVDFGKCQHSFGWFSWSKKDSNYLDVKLKVFQKDDNKDFHRVLNVTMGEADFNKLKQFRNQLIIAVKNFARAENVSPVLIPTMSRDTDEQLKLAHKVVNVVDCPWRKMSVTLLRYNVDQPKSSYA